jgi:3-methyladenine DNA glycosylase AlkD
MAHLKAAGSPRNVEGMARYGIVARSAFGVPTPEVERLAREIGRNHALAADLWRTGNHDARALAVLIEDPQLVTEEQMEAWALDFDNWAVCDGCCMHLFDQTPFAWPKTREWSARDEEFVKRAGYTLMAALAVHDKKAPDRRFLSLLPAIKRGSTDERNYVRKAVNWALRAIGKRDQALNKAAILASEQIRRLDSRAARWIAADALRELKSEAVQKRLASRKS